MSHKPAFSAAIEVAPADADYVAYLDADRSWVVVKRNPADAWFDVANCSREGYDLFVAGASAAGKSVYNAVEQRFECGSAAQVMGAANV